MSRETGCKAGLLPNFWHNVEILTKKSGLYKETEISDLINETQQLLEEISKDTNNISDASIGELLFKISTLSEKADIDPEEALFKTTNSFIDKFKN